MAAADEDERRPASPVTGTLGTQLPEFAKPTTHPTFSESGEASGSFQQTVQASLTMSASALPFVPPDILAEYERAHPGLAAKLIEWTERQQAHRMELERIRTLGSEKRLSRSQIGSLIVAVGGLSIAGAVAIAGAGTAAAGWSACIIAIVAVGGPVAAVALARRMGLPQNQTQKHLVPEVPVVAGPSEGTKTG